MGGTRPKVSYMNLWMINQLVRNKEVIPTLEHTLIVVRSTKSAELIVAKDTCTAKFDENF